MCSIAIFSSTKSLNFSMTYFAKNIIHMNFLECFVVYCIIDSFYPLPLINFFAFLLATLKYIKGKIFTLQIIDQFKGVLFTRTKLLLKLLERDSFTG